MSNISDNNLNIYIYLLVEKLCEFLCIGEPITKKFIQKKVTVNIFFLRPCFFNKITVVVGLASVYN